MECVCNASKLTFSKLFMKTTLVTIVDKKKLACEKVYFKFY